MREKRENNSLKVKVCIILTFIVFGILVMFFVVLPSLLITDVISFVSSGSSLFFPSIPASHFLWFLPEEFHGLPLSLGQFLDICVILLIILQTASTIYIILARFYRYQPSSAEIPVEVKRKFGEVLPNFMRWNILPHGHHVFGEKPDGKFRQKFTESYRDLQGTRSEEQMRLPEEMIYQLHPPSPIPSLSKNRPLCSGYILGLKLQHLLDCNILVSHFDRLIPVPYGCRARNSPHILASSCFSCTYNPNQKLEVVA